MGHPQPPNPMLVDNSAAHSIVRDFQPRTIQSDTYYILLGAELIQKKHFRIFGEAGKKNMADYFTKHHPI